MKIKIEKEERIITVIVINRKMKKSKSFTIYDTSVNEVFDLVKKGVVDNSTTSYL